MFVPEGPIDIKLALVQVMVWHRIDAVPIHWRIYAGPGGDELILIGLNNKHICSYSVIYTNDYLDRKKIQRKLFYRNKISNKMSWYCHLHGSRHVGP